MEVQEVQLDQLVFDEKYQSRADLPSVEEYTEIIQDAGEWPFPPLVVALVRKKHYVVDGFTRGRAAKQTDIESVPCEVHRVSEAEAFKMSLRANAENGYRRTNRDKRKAVERAIGRWSSETNAEIARICGVTAAFVGKVVKQYVDQDNGSIDPIKYEDHEPARQVVQLDEWCPVCQANDWVEEEDGHTCAVCKHVYGESPGTDDEEVIPEEPQPLPPEPVKREGMEDDDAKQHKEAKRCFGTVIRYLDRVGKLDQLETQVNAVLEALK